MNGKELYAVLLAGGLLLYWSTLFGIRYLGDRGRRAEQRRAIEGHVTALRAAIEKERRKREVNQSSGNIEYGAWKRFVSAFDSQQERTSGTRKLLALGSFFEWLPACLMAVWTIYVIVARVIHLLPNASS